MAFTTPIRMATLISDEVDLRKKTITIDKEGHYIMLEGSIHQDNIVILTVYTPNNSLKLHETKIDKAERRNKPPITAGDFNTTSLSKQENH